MIRSISKLASGGLLALLALAGCKDQPRSEPAAYPEEEPAPPPVEQPGAAQQWGQPGTPGDAMGQPGQQPGQWAQPGQQPGQWAQPGQQPGQAGQQPSQPAQPGQDRQDDQTAAARDPELTMIGIDIDTKLAQTCKIPGTNIFFKFDSARLEEDARERLQQIATCVTTGPAKGKQLLIVGHTDPRGADDYNKQLGMSRAESVARYLQGAGVKSARVELESMGAEGSPREPKTWPLQRRVTVRLQ